MVKAASVHSTPVGLFEFCVSGALRCKGENDEIDSFCLNTNKLSLPFFRHDFLSVYKQQFDKTVPYLGT